jgi:hypothetical protein
MIYSYQGLNGQKLLLALTTQGECYNTTAVVAVAAVAIMLKLMFVHSMMRSTLRVCIFNQGTGLIRCTLSGLINLLLLYDIMLT